MESLPLSRLQSNLTCSICQGYLIDATTITECMHTFCKSCLLQRVESGRTFCPNCGVQLQRSRLAEQLRLDHAVQALVYAAVPGLWQEEQRRRKHFVDHHPLSTSVAPPLQHPTCFAPSDPISLSLDFIPQSRDEDTNLNLKGPNSPQSIGRRFFRCPAAVAIHHFQKLLSLKFELPPYYVVEIYCQTEKLPSTFRLMDVAYKTGWTQEEPLRLEYKIVKNQPGKSTTLIAATGSAANNVSQSHSWRSKTSSAEVVTNSGSVKRSTGTSPSQSTPPKQQRRSSLVSPVQHTSLRNGVDTAEPRRDEESVRRSSSKRSSDAADLGPPSSKKRGRKKRRRRKGSSDLVPIMEPSHPLKVKIVERTKSAEVIWSPPSRPNGVELLVQAAELASRQNPTPPPPPSLPPTPEEPPAPPPPAVRVEPKRKTPPPLIPLGVPVANSDPSGDSINNNSTATNLVETSPKPVANKLADDDDDRKSVIEVTELDDLDDDGKLMIADAEVNLNGSSSSNGRDSGMANDEDEDDSAGALDLSAKSTRTITPPEESAKFEPRKSVSPQLVQHQRSTTLHSITDSLAQRQRQRLMQQQQQQQPSIKSSQQQPNRASQQVKQPQQHRHEPQQQKVPHLHRVPTPIHHHPETMRDLVTLSQTAALVSPERVATQRFIVAMHQFAAAAAAAAASAPTRPPKPPPQSPNKSFSYGLVRRPF